jgi:hypothetical protein
MIADPSSAAAVSPMNAGWEWMNPATVSPGRKPQAVPVTVAPCATTYTLNVACVGSQGVVDVGEGLGLALAQFVESGGAL